MSLSPARAAAYDILVRIEREESYADELLHSSQNAKLSSADHGLATELVMGVLRWRSLLDARIAAHSSQNLGKLDLEVLTALRLAAYQLIFLDRVPGHAAVNESVELVKRARKSSAAPFANAVLRKLAGEPRQRIEIAHAKDAAELSQAAAHPRWIVERWVRAFDIAQARKICEYDQRIPEISLRLYGAGAEEELKREGVEVAAGTLIASARRVVSGQVTQAKVFRGGQVAIQDEASQLVALLAGHGSRILDCCAAPGGKTRVLAQRNPDATIIAAELHPRRARLMRTLVPEPNVRIITADARALPLSASFDLVLADVPCTGTGTLAHNPEIRWRLKPDDLGDLQTRQIAILQSAMQYVAPGGRLVYSTCSLEPEENEEVLAQAMKANPAFRVVDCRQQLEKLQAEGELAWADVESLTSEPYLRTIPGVHPCDGFFASILERC
jgi:16S rRNA (cytosine967-C5)-methyltransferase